MARPVLELINLPIEEMTPEEQAILYETLRNSLVAMGAGSPAFNEAAHQLPETASDPGLLELLREHYRSQLASRGIQPQPQQVRPRSRLTELLGELPGAVGNILTENPAIKYLVRPSEAVEDISEVTERFMEGKPILGTGAAPTAPPTIAAPVTPAPPAAAAPAAAPKAAIRAVRDPATGRITFTNVPAGAMAAPQGESLSYEQGLGDWKAHALATQPSEEDVMARIVASGIVPQGSGRVGSFRVREGPGGFMAGGDVPAPPGAPPEWAKMTPGQRDEYLRQVEETGAVARARTAAAGARDAEDPVAAQLRLSRALRAEAERQLADPQSVANRAIESTVAAARAQQRLTPEQEELIRQTKRREEAARIVRELEEGYAASRPETQGGAAVFSRGGLGGV